MKNNLDYSGDILSAEENYLNLIVAVDGLYGIEIGLLSGNEK
jgi:hypothetical protein